MALRPKPYVPLHMEGFCVPYSCTRARPCLKVKHKRDKGPWIERTGQQLGRVKIALRGGGGGGLEKGLSSLAPWF